MLYSLPGFVLGTSLGLASAVLIGGARTISHSAQTAWHVFAHITNNALAKGNKDENFGKDTRNSDLQKYVVGFPGLIVGSIFGLGVALGIVTEKWIKQSALSWFYLSGSLLNLGLDHTIFTGISRDNRRNTIKYFGGVGYIVAIATTGVVSLGCAISIKVFTFIAFTIGIICSPGIAPFKRGENILHPRFETNVSPITTLTGESSESTTTNRFKNLYSSLDAWGNLQENKDILPNQNGGKGTLCFARKAVTFNISTMTEHTFNALLAAYRQSNTKPTFFDTDNVEVKTALKKVKQHYNNLGSWLDTKEEINHRNEQIDDIGQFVLEYLSDGNSHVSPTLYKKHNIQHKTDFLGRSLTTRLALLTPAILINHY